MSQALIYILDSFIYIGIAIGLISCGYFPSAEKDVKEVYKKILIYAWFAVFVVSGVTFFIQCINDNPNYIFKYFMAFVNVSCVVVAVIIAIRQPPITSDEKKDDDDELGPPPMYP